MGDDNNSQTSLVSQHDDRSISRAGYQPVNGESVPSSSVCSFKVGLVLTAAMVIAGAMGFVAGADFGPTVAPQLRGSLEDTVGTTHKVIAVVPKGVEATAQEHHAASHVVVVTDAEEEEEEEEEHRVHEHHERSGSSAHHGGEARSSLRNSSGQSTHGNRLHHNHTNHTNHTHHANHTHRANHTKAPKKPPACNTTAWPDKANGLVCGECKVLVDKFHFLYETCDNYCGVQGRKCVGAWEDQEKSCDVKHKIRCDEALFTRDAVCECGKHEVEGLREKFAVLKAKKVKASCGEAQENVDFWTDGSLFSAGNVGSADMCRQMCQNQGGCGAWTWGNPKKEVLGLTHMCFLKKVDWGHSIIVHNKTGLISGHPWGPRCDEFEPNFYTAPQEKEHEKDEGYAQDDPDHLHGVIRNKHGFCLDSAEPHKNNSVVQMMACKNGSDSQAWQWEEKTGQVKNKKGFCLATDSFQELSTLRTIECDTLSWNQQWDFFPGKGTVKNWRGPCLDAGERDRDGGMVYLRACSKENWDQQWEIGPLEGMNITKFEPVKKPMSLYCFALMLPGSYEQDLLAFQYKSKISLFACDGYAVYSNQEIQVTDGLVSGVVDSDLKCKKGGEFGTALNLDIFLAVWKKVVSDAAFIDHDWTAKVDPDAVFFPQRLRSIVAMHPETENGVYLNNCKFGLHGPIEVFSKNAVISWSDGSKRCVDHFWKLCHGDCLWGEDLFIDQCLSKVLGVRRENDYRILTEDHCDPPKEWDSCGDTTRVAFHPFKNETGYQRCLRNAERADAGLPVLVYHPEPQVHKNQTHKEESHREAHKEEAHKEEAHKEEAQKEEAHNEESHEKSRKESHGETHEQSHEESHETSHKESHEKAHEASDEEKVEKSDKH